MRSTLSQCNWSDGVSHEHNICLSVLAGCPAPSRWHPYRVHSVSSFSNTSKMQSGVYSNHTLPPSTTWGDINNLNPNDEFSVLAQVTITGQLYSGQMDTSLVNTPAIPPGKVPPVTILQANDMDLVVSSSFIYTSSWEGVLARAVLWFLLLLW